MSHFTDEELQLAKSVDLVEVARALGYTPKKIGSYYTLKEMDSIRIYNRKQWYRWSCQKGGSQIDFLQEFANQTVKEAVFWLLDFAGYQRAEGNDKSNVDTKRIAREEVKPRRKFILPEAAPNNERITQYLNQERCIRHGVIEYLIGQGLIYESAEHHNVIFKGTDKDGVTRFASMRGTYDAGGKKFKCDVAGNDKNYGFNLTCDASDEIYVFEGAIDLMSFLDISQNYEVNMLALGMVSDQPLERFIQEHPQIHKIYFCLDNDEPGRLATIRMMDKYEKAGFRVVDKPAPPNYKDFNEWLVATVRTLSKTEMANRKRV